MTTDEILDILTYTANGANQLMAIIAKKYGEGHIKITKEDIETYGVAPAYILRCDQGILHIGESDKLQPCAIAR